LVKGEYIDADVKLAQAAWDIYSNAKINDALKEKGFKRGSDVHKAFVVDGAKRVVDADMQKDLTNSQVREMNQRQNAHIELLEQILDPSITQEERERLLDENKEILARLEYKRNDAGVR